MNELKELKDRLSKINQLLDKLDEKLVQGELSEAKYKELAGKYRAEADSLKNQIAEKELLHDVGLKTDEKEDVVYPEDEPEKPVFEGHGTKYCSSCGTLINENSEFCNNCGERVSTPQIYREKKIHNNNINTNVNVSVSTPQVYQEKKSAALAVVLSFFIPGLGQMYCGKAARGVGILVLSIMMFFVFGYTAGSNPNSSDAAFPFLLWILVYIWNIYDAYKLVGKINRGEAY